MLNMNFFIDKDDTCSSYIIIDLLMALCISMFYFNELEYEKKRKKKKEVSNMMEY